MRTLTCIAALSAALLMTHSVFAASAVVKACRTDIKSQCGDEMKTGGAALKDCMKTAFLRPVRGLSGGDHPRGGGSKGLQGRRQEALRRR